MHRRRWARLFAPLACFVVFLSGSWIAIAADSGGSIAGAVSNTATGNLLQGARVEIAQLGLSALTDNSGRFVLIDVPPGTYDVTAAYTGLDTQHAQVAVASGRRETRNFDLTSGIYQLQTFKVTGEREGLAAAVTAQRNADNVKNVVAMDSFGNLPNMSAGELAIRLPGVAGNLDDEGNVTGLTVRGMGPTLNRVTVDGGLIPATAAMSRQFQTHSMSGAVFESLEVVKGHTPDGGADSLGGTVNLKTRSTLGMKEKRRITYSFGARWRPNFTEQVPLLSDHPMHPILNFAYQEVFSVLGGERNLGVAVNTFYSENVNGGFRTIRDFQNTPTTPAYLWDYRTQDSFNNRMYTSINVKFDFRLSANSKFTLNTIFNNSFEPFNRLYEVRAFTSQNIAVIVNGQPTGTNAILPDFTDKITRVRGVPASDVQITETMFSFLNRTRAADFGGEHDFGRLHLDYNAAYSQTHSHLGVGGGGTLSADVTGVGWVLDRTQSDLYPKFTQTEGPDISNIANYRPGQLTTRNGERNSSIKDARGNARYSLPTSFPLSLKIGGQYREQVAAEVGRNQRWNYLGGTKPLATDPSIIMSDTLKTGRKLPYFETAAYIKDYKIVDPSLWGEDNYFRESQRYIGTRDVTETVTAGYGMFQGKINHLGFLGGVRTEKTDVDAFGWVRAHVGSTAAQQTADPVGSAQRDYANTARTVTGSYTKSFPSIHFTYDVATNLKAHASWSTSFGRPPFGNLLPGETFNDTNRTLTINNPALKPQYAKNWDTTLEYYFEPAGSFTVGWFQKSIKDYIVSGISSGTVPTGTSNGYNGEYGGYEILTSSNAGTAYVQGWELSYQQQFTFLPGLLKGLGLSGNYTYLRTHGDFGGTTQLSTNQVAGFFPQTGNVNLFYKYRAFNMRVLANYTGRYITSFTAATPARNVYRYARTIVNLGFGWQLNPRATLFCDVTNLFNEYQQQYRNIGSQMERTIINGTTITFGVNGRF